MIIITLKETRLCHLQKIIGNWMNNKKLTSFIKTKHMYLDLYYLTINTHMKKQTVYRYLQFSKQAKDDARFK